MTDHSAMTKVVLLKDGRMLECSVAQLERINEAIMSSNEFEKIQIKLQGVYFTLGDLETDPEKLANAKQQGLPLDDKKAVHKNQDMG